MSTKEIPPRNNSLFFLGFIVVFCEILIRIILQTLPLPDHIPLIYQWVISATVRVFILYILFLFSSRTHTPLHWKLWGKTPRTEILIALPFLLGGSLILTLYHYNIFDLTTILSPVKAHPTPLQLTIWVLFAVIIAPLCEEILFRSIIYRAIRDTITAPPWIRVTIASIISPLIFAAFHLTSLSLLGIQQTIIPFICGVLGCALFQWRDNILAATLIHSAANLSLFLLAYL